MERSKVGVIIRTGLVRVLLQLSGFLVRVTGLINRGQMIDDVEGMNENPDSWPAEWTQRIKNAKHVTWFSFKAQRNVSFQGQKSVKNAAHQDSVSKTELLNHRDMDDSSRVHEPHSWAGPVSIGNSPPPLKVFDPRTRLWVDASEEEPNAAEPARVPMDMDGGLPVSGKAGSGKAGSRPNLTRFPFQNAESVKPLPESVGNRFEAFDSKSSSPPRKTQEAGIDSGAQLHGKLTETNRFETSSFQTATQSETRFPETIRHASKASVMSTQEIPTGNVPPYPRWTEIGAFDDPSVPHQKPPFSSPEDKGLKEQGMPSKGFSEDPAPTLNRPWPELEEFEFPRDTTMSANRDDGHRRLLQLILEQKGSLWRVSRF